MATMRRGSIATLVFITATIGLVYFFSASDSIFRQSKSQATSPQNTRSISSLSREMNLPEDKEKIARSSTTIQSLASNDHPTIEVNIKDGDNQNHAKGMCTCHFKISKVGRVIPATG